MNKKFSLIVSDPCWNFSDSLTMSDVKRGAAANYSLMLNSDIIALNVKDLADPDGCVLALWVPSSLLQEGLDTMKAWGFSHKQTYIWVKVKKNIFNWIYKTTKGIVKSDTSYTKETFLQLAKTLEESLVNFDLNEVLAFFMGRLFRQTHEICLIGTNNNNIYKKLKNKSQRSVSFAPNIKHSAKPENLQDSLEVMFPDAEKLEMFSRRQRLGWTCIGNEAPNTFGEDIRESISKLLLK